MILYEKARALLKSEYETHRARASNTKLLMFLNEKWRHSLQVAGAGNLILKNEPYFQGRDGKFLEKAKIAVLLHDVFRFEEYDLRYKKGQLVDHGASAAEMLQNIPEFNDILITLPIKHHGHMIEDFYADDKYQTLSENTLKEDVCHIVFLVRDADKIANWQILVHENTSMRPIWYPFAEDSSEKQAEIPLKLWEDFKNHKVSKGVYRETNAAMLMATLCWIFDMNYQSSVLFCKNLDLFNGFFQLLEYVKIQPQKILQIKSIVQTYVKERFELEI